MELEIVVGESVASKGQLSLRRTEISGASDLQLGLLTRTSSLAVATLDENTLAAPNINKYTNPINTNPMDFLPLFTPSFLHAHPIFASCQIVARADP